MVRECYVGANHKTAVEECRAALQYKYDAYASWGLSSRKQPTFEELARNRFIIGDAVVREGRNCALPRGVSASTTS